MNDTRSIDAGEASHQRELEAVIQAAAGMIVRTVLGALQKDGHQWSTRPCGTCTAISALVGYPFGCDQFRIEKAGR